MENSVTLSVVVPCHNEENNIRHFYDVAKKVLDGTNESYEIIYVNDGSQDNSLEEMRKIAELDKNVKVINFSRNFGQEAGILAGFKLSKGKAVVDIDADLQDPIDAIPKMLYMWKNGYKIVHGRRSERKGESLFKKFTSRLYGKIINSLVSQKLPEKVGHFKLFDRQVVDIIVNMKEHDRFIKGQTAWVGFKQGYVDFVREPRYAGKTNYSIKQLFKLANDGVFINSKKPLSFSLFLGLTFLGLSFVSLVAFIVLLICGVSLATVYWFFPFVSFCMSMLFFNSYITNQYIGRIYDEVKDRPIYVIDETINF